MAVLTLTIKMNEYCRKMPSWTDEQIRKDIISVLKEEYDTGSKQEGDETWIFIRDKRDTNAFIKDAFAGIWPDVINWVIRAPSEIKYKVRNLFIEKFLADVKRIWEASYPHTKLSLYGCGVPFMIIVKPK